MVSLDELQTVCLSVADQTTQPVSSHLCLKSHKQ